MFPISFRSNNNDIAEYRVRVELEPFAMKRAKIGITDAKVPALRMAASS